MSSSSSRGRRGRGGGDPGPGPSDHRGRGRGRGRGDGGPSPGPSGHRGRGRGDGGSSPGPSGHRGRGRRGDGGPSPSPSGHRGRDRGRSQGGVPPINRTSVREGKCSFYWSTGACNRGFDCTFKHEARPGVQAPSSVRQPTDFTPDFFSPEGLAINTGSVVDSQHNLSPSEVHNHLKPFLLDNFVFRDAIHVEGFSRIFASVNARNRGWVRDDTS